MTTMRRLTLTLTAMMLLVGATSTAAAGDPSDRQSSDVMAIADGSIVGDARLIRTDSGVRYSLRTSSLVEGHAVTVWWVIFNNPEECEHGEGELACGEPDLFVDYPQDLAPDPDVDPAVMAAGGNLVGSSGRSSFAASLTEGEVTAEHPLFTGGPGLTNPRGAEIHLVVRSHGPKVEARMPEQIETFEGGCEVLLDPGTMPTDEGECADLQFTAFE